MQPESIELDVDNQKVRGKLFKPQGRAQRLAVLLLHGWTGQANTDAAAVLADAGYWTLALCMRGHGNSDGNLRDVTPRMSLDDVLKAYDFLIERLPSGTGIVPVGNSYGAYLAVLLAAERKVAAISLRVPSVYPDDGFDTPEMGRGGLVRDWRLGSLPWQENRAFTALHNFGGPVQIIEAEHDEWIPHESVENYLAALPDGSVPDYHFMHGWTHALGGNVEWNQEFRRILLAWLDSVAGHQN